MYMYIPTQNFKVLLVHTDDNNPPQWLDYGVVTSGFSANFSVLVSFRQSSPNFNKGFQRQGSEPS
jgi:hypothetical protein